MIAGDIATAAAAILNDSAQALYTFAAQLPHIRKANEDLELLMAAAGISVTRQVSTILPVPQSTSNIVLFNTPGDMFVPISILERLMGSTDQFIGVDEREWVPEILPTQSLSYWVFRNNKILFPPVSSDREVKIQYWRQLAPIATVNSVEEVLLSKTYLASRTAELCARYIGENTVRADEIRDNEVMQAKDGLERVYIKNSQGNRTRRRRFKRTGSTRWL